MPVICRQHLQAPEAPNNLQFSKLQIGCKGLRLPEADRQDMPTDDKKMSVVGVTNKGQTRLKTQKLDKQRTMICSVRISI